VAVAEREVDRPVLEVRDLDARASYLLKKRKFLK
jgi:hypothetical protein